MQNEIREGLYSDAFDIATVHISSWKTTYKGIVSGEYLNTLEISDRTKKWEKILNCNSQKVFVYLNGGKIVGFATCGKSYTVKGYDCEISSIYILEGYQGKGIGTALFKQCYSYLKSIVCKNMYIWVLAGNTAVGFYQKMGGKYITNKEVNIGDNIYREDAYGWNLE